MKSLLALIVILFGACTREQATPVRVPVASTAGNIERGGELMTTYGCNTCHIIPGVDGPRATLGPPLQAVGTRPSINLKIPNTPENMAQWLRDPRSLDPDSTMPELGVTPADATDMTAYLFSLR
jgi:cytochrome c